MFYQLLQRNADYRPNDIAIVFAERSISNVDLLDQVSSVASGLRSLGHQPGDRVGLLLENSPEFIVSFFAVAAIRGTNLPLNFEFKQEELSFYLGDARAKFLIVDQARLHLAIAAVAELDHAVTLIVVGESDDQSHVRFAALLDTPGDKDLGSCSLSDDLVYLYTSGSTGRPKCAPRTVVQYWWEMDDVIECFKLTRADAIFCAIPLFHNFAAVQCMLASIGAGARLVIFERPNPFVLRRKAALKLMEKEKVTILPWVPYIIESLADSSLTADLSSVRLCYGGSATLNAAKGRAFSERFGLAVRQHYGCTEVGAMTILLHEDPKDFMDSVGVAFPGVSLRILDDAGAEVPTGEIGEVVVTSRSMTRGYLGVGQQGNTMFRNGAFYTGDLGRLDEAGRLYLCGRKKLIIDVAGHKVSPIEVEDVLASHPAVQNSVVIGVPGNNGTGQAVHAYVVLTDDHESYDQRELMAHCRERLANFKVPTRLTYISELPITATGKVMRRRDEIERFLCFPELESMSAEGVA